MSLNELYLALFAGGVVLLASIVATRIASRVGLPSLLLFLAVGVILGEDVLGVDLDDPQLAQNLGTAALAIILVEGGLTTKWSDVSELLAPAGVLATLGVGVSVGITALGAHFFLGLDWQLALLLGAVLASTDAAAVFSVLRVLPLPRRMVGLLEAESGFNDAPTVILVLLFSSTPLRMQPWHLLGSLVYQLVVGAAIGILLGVIGSLVLPRIALPASGLYPLAIFGLGMLAFAAAGVARSSGFIAAYLAGVVLANAGLPHRSATRSFAEGLGWLAQIGLFVLLGLLVTPSELHREVLPALVIGVVLLLLARPLAVVVSLLGFRFPLREQAFLSWAGLRGAVPIVLATFPVVAGVRGSDRLVDIVFVLILVLTLVQGPSLRALARWLGLIRPEAAREVQVESAPLDVLDAELLTVTIPRGSRLHYVTVLELQLPEPSVPALVIREYGVFVPRPESRLEEEDQLLIVTTTAKREATERRLRAVGRRGKLAYWFGEYGDHI
ncbi:potassium/proton antiporter [Actinopolyspora saharensis]|uniref:Potassium/proton antiporter, CPA1 family n=1 Tax=Actinopolyspora saharensis TaxID=995062 RepID=A0A1H1ERC8_9ACTN|nr:potassium/proton antiporter [Actinopolyspora saharensis]SDQ90676.1 potassium/proton antiporter, CPA1 family [Actinopolyspora saharensis]